MKLVSKMPVRFLFQDLLKEFSFLDPRNRNKSSLNGVIQLESPFTSFSVDEMDSLSIEFRDFRSATNCLLPSFNASDGSAIDSFWAAIASIRSVTNLESFHFDYLSKLAQTFLTGFLVWRGRLKQKNVLN